jgi:Mrp family chromosome partitioning ATPase
LIKRLSEEYDLVILDCCMLSQPNPPLAGIGNPSAIQAAIVVADAELSSHERTQAACNALNAVGLSSVGIVENFRP